MIATEFAQAPGIATELACLRRRHLNSAGVVSFRFASISVCAFLLVLSSCSRSKLASPTSDASDPVAFFVQHYMQPGSAAFVVPSPVNRDDPAEAVLEITPPTIKPDVLQQELERLAGRPSVGSSGSIKVGSRMVATLVADRECTITPKDPPDQAVVADQGTTWRWSVTPHVRGTTRLTVTLMAQVVLDGRETSYRVTSFEKTVKVAVTNTGVITDALDWARNYWPVLAGVGTVLVGVVAWLRKRGAKHRGKFGF